MEQLVKKAKNGDKDAFCQLMKLNMQTMYKIAWSFLRNNEDVADAVQESICVCYEKLNTLKSNHYFKTWFVKILINQCKNILTERKKLISLDQVPENSAEETSYSNVEWKQLLDTLEEKYRMVLLLYYMEDFNVREIAELLDISVNTVKTRLSRGRKLLVEDEKKTEEVAYEYNDQPNRARA